MTIITAKLFGAVGLLTGAGAATLAAIDSTTQTALIGVASLTITSLTAIILAWIAYKQNVLAKKQDALVEKQNAMAVVVDDVKKQTDGINTQLVEATGRAKMAEGQLKGQADAQVRQDAIDAESSVKVTKSQSEPTLKKIEKNTAETADNTAKTEATVQDLKDKA